MDCFHNSLRGNISSITSRHSISRKRTAQTYALLTVIILISLTLYSCAQIIFPDFKIEKVEHNKKEICIYFSSEPDVISIKKSFTLTKDNYLEDGTFSFSGKKAVFTPFKGIEENHDYIITISTDAESVNGESLLNKYMLSFSTKEKNIALEITDFEKSNQEEKDILKISFNESIKQESFSSAFSITPAIQYFVLWNNDFTCAKIQFHTNLQNNQRYIISINTNLSDIYNNKLTDTFTNTFIHNPYYENTAVKAYAISEKNNSSTELIQNDITQNICIDSKIKILFDNEINIESAVSAISITPETSFTIEKNNITKKELTIVFSSPPVYKTRYKIKIAQSITDINQNTVPAAEYILDFSNPRDKPVSFIAGIIELKDDLFIFDENSNYETLFFPVNIYPTVNTITSPDINFYFIFELSDETDRINLLSAMENITISRTQNCIDFSPYRIEQITKAEFTQNPLYETLKTRIPQDKITENNFCVIKFNSTVQNNDSSGLVKISVSKDLCDNLSNKIDSPVTLSFNKK